MASRLCSTLLLPLHSAPSTLCSFYTLLLPQWWEWCGMGWDGMGWDGMGGMGGMGVMGVVWDGMGVGWEWSGMGVEHS